MESERGGLVGWSRPRPVTLVDSCVLLDLALEDPTWSEWSAHALVAAADEGPLAINPIIYAEVSLGYSAVEDVDTFLPAEDYFREPLPYQAGFLAGKAFVRYRRAGGAKQSPLPDFYIGAHAAVAGYRLLTRDKARYATHFPKVPLITP
ncbi:type II toxin-antitoxin system VapC family toxin [Actinoallomurus acanthiterrae]